MQRAQCGFQSLTRKRDAVIFYSVLIIIQVNIFLGHVELEFIVILIISLIQMFSYYKSFCDDVRLNYLLN